LFKRILIIVLAVAIAGTSSGLHSSLAQTSVNADAVKARTKVDQIGTGSNARVEVKLKDGSKAKGYINAINDNSFTVTDSKTGVTATIAYTDVVEVKKSSGGGLSSRSWIIIGAAAAGAIVTWLVVKPAFCDGGAQSRFPC
jgi:hypothetical protein